jgi:hypothetical protein
MFANKVILDMVIQGGDQATGLGLCELLHTGDGKVSPCLILRHAIIGMFQYISTYYRDLRGRSLGSILLCLVSGRKAILAGQYYCDSNQPARAEMRPFCHITAQNCLVGSRGVAGASKTTAHLSLFRNNEAAIDRMHTGYATIRKARG